MPRHQITRSTSEKAQIYAFVTACISVATLIFAFVVADAHEVRSRVQRHKFRKENPCPSTGSTRGYCPGWHVDHIVPLACEGKVFVTRHGFVFDSPENMQWLPANENLKKGAQGCK